MKHEYQNRDSFPDIQQHVIKHVQSTDLIPGICDNSDNTISGQESTLSKMQVRR